jgi:hypothetical protein
LNVQDPKTEACGGEIDILILDAGVVVFGDAGVEGERG